MSNDQDQNDDAGALPSQPSLGWIAAAALLVAMLLTQSLATASIVGPSILIVDAATDLGVPVTAIGGFVSFVFGAAMIGAVVSGAAMARFGAMGVAQLSLVGNAVGISLVATGSIPAAVMGGMVIGAAYGSCTPTSIQLLARYTPARHRALLFSIRQTGVPLGGVFAGLLMPPMVPSFGWQVPLLGVAICSLVLAALMLPWRARLDAETGMEARGDAPGPIEPLRQVLADGALRQLALVAFLFGALQVCFSGYLAIALTGAGGLTLVAAGHIIAVLNVSGVVGRVAWGWLADRLRRGRLVLGFLALVIAACCLIVYSLAPGWPQVALMAAGILMGASTHGWNGVYVSETVRLAPTGQGGAIIGGSNVFAFLGSLAGPAAFGIGVALLGSVTVTFGILTLVALGAAVPMLVRRGR